MDEAALCDRLLLLHQGRILAQGSPAELLAAYPYRLFRIDGREGNLHYPADKAPPEGFALIYPSAGSLHAAMPKSSGTPDDRAMVDRGMDDLLRRIRAQVTGAETIRPIAPSVEDAFFALLAPVAAGPGEEGATPEDGTVPKDRTAQKRRSAPDVGTAPGDPQ
jgi:ABC-type multidrug transport system ATPase subunit